MKRNKLVVSIFTLSLGVAAYAQAIPAKPTLQTKPFPTAGKVMTPVGELDKACVHEIPHGARVDHHGVVTLNGAKVMQHTLCTAPHRLELPSKIAKAGLQPPTTNGWVEASWANATTISGVTSFDWLYAQFTVPSAPSANNGQLIYLFPSLESNGTEIIQPVLQYGSNGSFGGNYWVLASWYVSSTNAFWSTPITVSAGDSITGFMGLVDGTNAGYDVWNVYGNDTTAGTSSGMAFNTDKGPFNEAQQGVLEVYNVSDCSSYPAAGDIIFGSVQAWQAGPSWNSYNSVSPGWFPTYWSASPSCSFNVNNYTYNGSEGTTLYF